MKTRQELFDQIARHLLTQRERAISPVSGKCSYFASNGLKCAVGCLIPEHMYSASMEDTSIRLAFDAGNSYEFSPRPALLRKALIAAGVDIGDHENERFLIHLQQIHDYYYSEEWRDLLFEAARTFQLNPSVLEDFS